MYINIDREFSRKGKQKKLKGEGAGALMCIVDLEVLQGEYEHYCRING